MITLSHIRALPFDVAVEWCSTAERSANRSSIIALAFSALLWVWVRAPSFDILPATISIVFKIAGLLTYGLFGPAESFVLTASTHINVGYAIIFGPPVVAFLTLAWWIKEDRAQRLIRALELHPVFFNVPPDDLAQETERRFARHRSYTNAFKALILLAACIALSLRFCDLRAPESLLLKPAREGCRHEGAWAFPWPNADSKLTWFRFSSDDWCIEKKGSGWGANFQSVLPDRFLENQRRENSSGSSWKTRIKDSLGLDVNDGNILLVLGIGMDDPYKTFPYAYPTLQVLLNITCIMWVAFMGWRLWRLWCPHIARKISSRDSTVSDSSNSSNNDELESPPTGGMPSVF